jgi:uncharacterized protein YehS (DUF1456 family)
MITGKLFMTNNDVLRRIRYIFDLNDKRMIKTFGFADVEVTRAEISAWLKQEDAPGYLAMSDTLLAVFLNGWINYKRGKREGDQPVPEKYLNNNLILLKLKIAMNLRSEEILEILKLVEFTMSEHELSAFFRKKGHQKYTECKDQVLRKFLKGMELKYRVSSTDEA